MKNDKPLLICLMGPTASGKTDVAMALSQHLPVDVISVDSALVYRGMDIGTAKPSPVALAKVPHRLVDILDPSDTYSVADFCVDAHREIDASLAKGRIPLLVGGSMMYFNALLKGLAAMPASDPAVRSQIMDEAAHLGWPALHAQLALLDPEYAAQLHPHHSQRIARALEVVRISGKTMTVFHREQQSLQQGSLAQKPLTQAHLQQRYRVVQLALLPPDRAALHRRIEQRFLNMMQTGFLEEVDGLYHRGDLHGDLPAMRAVGYRQLWSYFAGQWDKQTAVEKGIIATRQLAKRQLTWLRRWPNLHPLCADWQDNSPLLQKNLNATLKFLLGESI